MNFYADVRTQLKLSTNEGTQFWEGYLIVWGCAEQKEGFEITVEDMCSTPEYDRKGMLQLSPFLIPYFSPRELDSECEAILREFMPEALTDPKLRNAAKLAEAMGLQIFHYPIHEHKSVDSIIFLIDDTILVDDKNVFAEPKTVSVQANSIVINLNNIKRDYSAFNIFHEIMHFYEHYLFFRLQEMHNNDITQLKTQTIEVAADDKVENPIYWMEKQINIKKTLLKEPFAVLYMFYADYINDLYRASISSTVHSLGLPGRQASLYASIANW